MEQKTKLLLFEDFTKLYKRWDKGEIREEDKFKSNIGEMKEIDLGDDIPVLFADRDLIVNGNNKFTYDELEKFLQKILDTGWRLPAYMELRKIFYKNYQPPQFKDNLKQEWASEVSATITNKDTNAVLEFDIENKFSDKYWCMFNETLDKGMMNKNPQNARGFEVGDPRDYYGCIIRTNNFLKKDSCKIRLIKLKKE